VPSRPGRMLVQRKWPPRTDHVPGHRHADGVDRLATASITGAAGNLHAQPAGRSNKSFACRCGGCETWSE